MKVILATDALFPPLTGIGRYTLELLTGLRNHPRVTELQFFAHGHFVDNPTRLIEQHAQDEAASFSQPQSVASLRSRLARSRIAVRIYAAVTPHISRLRLAPHAGAVYHSPNFILPPFSGPSVATIHDLSTHLYPQFHPPARIDFMKHQLPLTLRRATHLITDSDAIRQEVIQHFSWPPEHITAIPLGVDPTFRPHSPEELLPILSAIHLQPGRYILCVATIEPRKNIDRLITAYLALPDRQRKHHPLVLVGSPGWNSDDLHRRIQGLQGQQIRYLRYLPQRELRAVMAGAALFAFPSLYEGFGLPVLEAMASGVPVVTSKHSSLPQASGGAALLCDPTDADAISLLLQRGLDDSVWRQQAIASGMAHARQHTWLQCVDRTVQVYRSLLPRGST